MPFLTLLDGHYRTLLNQLRSKRPLVHCLTNEVVQEMTANVLLASSCSPAMVVAEEEAEYFASIADAVLINIGTPYQDRLKAMHKAIDGAQHQDKPWVLDPVAAGVIPWRDEVIRAFMDRQPTVIRGNASEIMALANMGSGGKGVDSTDSSSAALEAAKALALSTHACICVTGEIDFVTDGNLTYQVEGGHPMSTLVVGTGCSLSALVAAFCSLSDQTLINTIAACRLAKEAAALAHQRSTGPGSFHQHYIDALYQILSHDS